MAWKKKRFKTKHLLLFYLLTISSICILIIFSVYHFGKKIISYAAGGTEFGMQIDSHYQGKIPDLIHLQQLNPAWIRGDYNKITFSPNWPANVKSLVLINNETTSSYLGMKPPFATWKNYVDGIYVPKIKQILQETPGIVAIEIWNEEDICDGPQYCPYMDAQSYSYMLVQATTAIKAMSPATKVIMGGLASAQVQYLKNVIQVNPSGFSKIDGVGLHPYGSSPGGWCVSGCSGGNLTTGDLATRVKSYQTIAGKPVWVTEIGTNSKDRIWQAEYLTRSFTVLQQLQVPVVIWFSWSDIMVPDFGLMDGNKKIKPSGDAFRKFNPQPTPFLSSLPVISISGNPSGMMPEETVPTFYCLGLGLSTGSCLTSAPVISPAPSQIPISVLPVKKENNIPPLVVGGGSIVLVIILFAFLLRKHA